MNHKPKISFITFCSFLLGFTSGFGTSLYFNQYIFPNFITKSSNQDCILDVLFTPGDACTNRIVQHIQGAKEEILLQAYSFTSVPIIEALITQHKKGVKIIIILDKSQENSIYTMKVQKAGIMVLIDKLSGIAHNKVVIIDKKKVFTGSFNFSLAAEKRNAENSLLIQDLKTVQKYLQYFHSRRKVSQTKNIQLTSKL